MSAIRCSLMLAALALLGAHAAGQPTAPSLPPSRPGHMILPLQNTTGRVEYELLGAAIADLLTVGLSRIDDLIVVDRERLEDVLAEHNLRLSGRADTDRDFVRQYLTGVTRLYTGSFTVTNGTLSVLLRAVDVETSAVVSSLEEKGTLGALERLCEQLAARLTQPLPSSPVWKPPSAVDTSPKANVHFARGLGYYWGGDCAQAVCEFLRTLSLQPDHEQARFWLGRGYFADGHWLDARFEFDKFAKACPLHALAGEAGRYSEQCERKMDASEKALLKEIDNFPSRRVNLRYWDWEP